MAQNKKKTRIIMEIQQLILAKGFTEYCELIEYLMDGGESSVEMFEVASNNPLFFDTYLTSRARKPVAMTKEDWDQPW